VRRLPRRSPTGEGGLVAALRLGKPPTPAQRGCPPKPEGRKRALSGLRLAGQPSGVTLFQKAFFGGARRLLPLKSRKVATISLALAKPEC